MAKINVSEWMFLLNKKRSGLFISDSYFLELLLVNNSIFNQSCLKCIFWYITFKRIFLTLRFRVNNKNWE